MSGENISSTINRMLASIADQAACHECARLRKALAAVSDTTPAQIGPKGEIITPAQIRNRPGYDQALAALVAHLKEHGRP